MCSYNRELVIDYLTRIGRSLDVIMYRFKPVKGVPDLTDSPQGREKLDSICMQLIAIGESVKKIDKITKGELLERYPNIDWKGVKGMRDIISHHYFNIDAEIIYEVCKNRIPELKETIEQILRDFTDEKGG